MKTITLSLLLILSSGSMLTAQSNNIEITRKNSTAFNRDAVFENGIVHLNANANDGILWINNLDFKNGTIELDIKGKNAQGQSFVGMAFHGIDNQMYDVVYFRPFNFKNPERKMHAIQYVSLPKHDWSTLRHAFPGKYENQMQPVPENEEDWFHTKIEVQHPHIKVYVNGSNSPALEIDLISETKHGKVGLWVGNGSEGWFRNLKIEQ
ncbi:MAG TPA: hypothetical protein DHV26_06655 [Cytophagales bacterium]|nr:hypothetical protein [Cytophagales bacterium]